MALGHVCVNARWEAVCSCTSYRAVLFQLQQQEQEGEQVANGQDEHKTILRVKLRDYFHCYCLLLLLIMLQFEPPPHVVAAASVCEVTHDSVPRRRSEVVVIPSPVVVVSGVPAVDKILGRSREGNVTLIISGGNDETRAPHGTGRVPSFGK